MLKIKPVASWSIFVSVIALFFTSCCLVGPERNLYFTKRDLVVYHDQGKYVSEQIRVVENAIRWIEQRSRNAKLSEKLAIVFDIDETSLSNWPYLEELDFGYSNSTVRIWLKKASCPAISPTKRLYDTAFENNVAVFFITGRRECLRTPTKKNLATAGYPKYAQLFMKPDNYSEPSVIPYKSAARKSVVASGYTIIANIGDQWSDLKAGYSERTFKLPNPFYFIP